MSVLSDAEAWKKNPVAPQPRPAAASPRCPCATTRRPSWIRATQCACAVDEPVRSPVSVALIAGLVAAGVLVLVTAPFMTRYGWDRDELYFLSAAHHLALGYVDFPPLIAVLGWMIDKAAPGSLVALRVVSLAAGAGTVVIVAFIAR
jgi:hypothetical protein